MIRLPTVRSTLPPRDAATAGQGPLSAVCKTSVGWMTTEIASTVTGNAQRSVNAYDAIGVALATECLDRLSRHGIRPGQREHVPAGFVRQSME
jgi:hypothetical protein